MNVIVLSAELEPARDFLIDVNDLLLAKIKGGKILPLYTIDSIFSLFIKCHTLFDLIKLK